MKKNALSLLAFCAFTWPTLAAMAAPAYKVTHAIAIAGEAHWDYLYTDGAQHRLYVSHGTQTEIIDTASEKLLATIPDTAGVHGVALAQDLGLGFTSNGKTDSITVFELATFKTVKTIKVGSNPDAIVYVPQAGRVVTFNGSSKDASVVDINKGEVVGTVAIGGKPEFAQVDKAGNIHFNIEDTAELAALDPVAMKLTQRTSVKPCDSPTGLAIDDQQRLYSVCDNKVMFVSGGDGKKIAQAAIGSGPDGVAWMDGFAFSANGADGTMSVVETGSGKFETVATVATATGARTIAADAATHKLYLPTSDFKPAPDGGRRQGVAGTFRILVVEKQ
jgi:DNA-binding beta-propeller fold protein YncE